MKKKKSSNYYCILFLVASLSLFILGVGIIAKNPIGGFFIGASFSCSFAVGWFFRELIYNKENKNV